MLADLSPDHDLSHLRLALSVTPPERRRLAIDVGAHRGIWTRELARHFAQVYAFEPCPSNYPLLCDNVPRHVQTFGFALGRSSAIAGLNPGEHNTGQWHIAEALAGELEEPIEMHSLDDVLRFKQDDDLDFLKIDVEGYELRVLEGAERVIERERPIVILEDNGLCERYGIPTGAAGQWLEHRGYRLHCQVRKDFIYLP